MDYLKNELKKIFVTSLVTSIIMMVMGVFLLMKPDFVLTTLSTIVGLIILIPGIISLVDYFKTQYMPNLVVGVILGILGLLFIFNPKFISSILPFVLGIFFIINGLSRLQYAIEMKKNKVPEYGPSLISSILILGCGVLLIINPFSGAMAITQVIGIFMIIYATLDIYNAVTTKQKVKDFVKEIKE
ncbi:MAG: DUF308 domain-containing protein [Bacilli bacterium]|nr:DUF308 domain-containing protein [Bacilli bacterium]